MKLYKDIKLLYVTWKEDSFIVKYRSCLEGGVCSRVSHGLTYALLF